MLYISVCMWIFGILSLAISVIGALSEPVQDDSPARKLIKMILYLLGSFVYWCVLPWALAFLQAIKAQGGFWFFMLYCFVYLLFVAISWLCAMVLAPAKNAPAWHAILVIFALIITIAGLF